MDDETPPTTFPAGFTRDSFQNLAAGLGIGADNLATTSSYGYSGLTKNRTTLEYMYRGSWIVRQIVDAPADDMTRAGIEFKTDIPPEDSEKLLRFFDSRSIWQELCSALRWSRLYGGCVAYIQIDGQRTDSPLRLDSVTSDQFNGIIPFDRWQVTPNLQDYVSVAGPHYGKPRYYKINNVDSPLSGRDIHYSRLIRFDGVELPYWQRLTEMSWGASVLEPILDRIINYDSTTTGAAQLVYKAHLRTYKIPQLREIIATGGTMYRALLDMVQLMRKLQSNEGITLLDGEDTFETHTYTFSGLDSLLSEFSHQLAGAAQMPMIKLFGTSPSGLGAAAGGNSELSAYYDTILSKQRATLAEPLTLLLNLASRSVLGKPLPEGFAFEFKTLWQTSETDKASITTSTATAIKDMHEAGIISQKIALQELKQLSVRTGVFTNITDEFIAAADDEPPAPQGEGDGPPEEDDGTGPVPPGMPPEQPQDAPDAGPASSVPSRPQVASPDAQADAPATSTIPSRRSPE